MTSKHIDSKNYRVVQYLNGTVIYQGWHEGCHIGGGGGLGGGSSYNAIGADVLPKWRELDEKRHYKLIAQLKKAVSEGRLKVIPVGELVNSEDFIAVDGVTVPREPMDFTWKGILKGIGKAIGKVIHVLLTEPRIHRKPIDLNQYKSLKAVEEQQKQDDEINEEEDEMMEAESGSDPN